MTNEELVKAVQRQVGKKFSDVEILAQAFVIVRRGFSGDLVELVIEKLKGL